jgi:innexin
MLLLLQPLKTFFQSDPVKIDSTTSLLHQATAIVLIVFSLLLASGQFLGTPMNCVVDLDTIPKAHIDDYCFVQTTFIALNHMDPTLVGKQTSHRGVGAGYIEPKDHKNNSFYQWVCFVLCFQGFCFYFPHYMWSLWEGGKMRMLVMDLSSPVVAEDKKNERKMLLVDFFSKNLHRNKTYALGFFLSDLFSLSNVIGQICFTDWFLGGQFINYGLAVLGIHNEEMRDASEAMALVFQR